MTAAALLNAVDIPYTASCLMPDNGLASLAACLMEAGHEVAVWDLGTLRTLRDHVGPAERRDMAAMRSRMAAGPITDALVAEMRLLDRRIGLGLRAIYARTLDELDRHIRTHDVRLLGLKLWIGAGSDLALEVAEELVRRHPSLQVYAGGPLAVLAPGRVLDRAPVVRAVCVGEGEETIVGLAEVAAGRRELTSVPNLRHRDGGGHRSTAPSAPYLASLPAPVYHPAVYPTLSEGEQIPVLCVNESRGCPMGCSFCAHGELSGRRPRSLHPDRIAALMDDAWRRYGVFAHRFSGSFTPGRIYREVARRIEGRDYRVSGFAHVNGLRVADLEPLQRAGVVALFFGVESAAEELLCGPLGKNTRPDRIEEVLRATMDAGIFACGSTIVPSPGETEETEAATLRLLLDLFEGSDRGSALALPALPQPGARWWAEMEAFGFEGDRDAILEALCSRRIRTFLPMNVFEPLPYRLDGRSFAEMAARTARFTRALKRRGVITNLGDDGVLIARAAGYSPREFHELNHRMFLTADADLAGEVIQRIRSRALQRRALDRAEPRVADMAV